MYRKLIDDHQRKVGLSRPLDSWLMTTKNSDGVGDPQHISGVAGDISAQNMEAAGTDRLFELARSVMAEKKPRARAVDVDGVLEDVLSGKRGMSSRFVDDMTFESAEKVTLSSEEKRKALAQYGDLFKESVSVQEESALIDIAASSERHSPEDGSDEINERYLELIEDAWSQQEPLRAARLIEKQLAANFQALLSRYRTQDGKDITNIYHLLSVLFREEPVRGHRIYEMLRSYGTALARAGKHAAALQVFMDLAAEFPEDLRNYYNMGTCCKQLGDVGEVIEHYKKSLSYAERQLNSERKQHIINMLGRVYRENLLLDEATELIREAKLRNDYEAFFSLLSCHLEIDNDLKYMDLQEMMLERVDALNDLFVRNIDNGVIPLSHLRWITKVAFTDTVSEKHPGHVGQLNVAHPRKRMLTVFSKGLTPSEIYYVLCHEVGHNVFSQLTEEQQEAWNVLARKYDLVHHYRERAGEASLEEEAFADMYAAFIMMKGYWSVSYDVSRGKDPDSLNVKVYEFMQEVFMTLAPTDEREFVVGFGPEHVDRAYDGPVDFAKDPFWKE